MMHRTRKAFAVLLLWLLATTAVYATDTVTYVYTDPQGTPLAETDAKGNITATFDYTPYGSVALGNSPNGPGYTGHVNDSEANLVYMQARYFDPATGRFLSVDPVMPDEGNAFNFNRYDYANNNPIVNLDPTGRACGGGGEVDPKVQKMRDASDNCGETSGRSSSGSGPASSTGHTAVQLLIGVLKGASNELCKIPIVSCDEGGPEVAPSNETQSKGMAGGVFLVQMGEAVATDGDSVEAEVPIWTSTGSKTSVENAFMHWKKHTEEFPEYKNSLQYVQGARRFVTSPPNGTLVKVRANGDTLLYDPRTNTFAVKAANGTPRTMFRPASGKSYWEKQ